MNGPKKTAIDEVISTVSVKLLDPLGKGIEGLKYQIRDGQKIVSKGATDAEGTIASFVSAIGSVLTVHVERFGTEEMKLIKKLTPWSEDFGVKLVSGKVKEKVKTQQDAGDPGAYKRKTYKVKSGDTLGKIAPRYGTNAEALAKLNGIKVTDIIHINQVLKVPNDPIKNGKAGPSAPPVTPAATLPAPPPIAPPVSSAPPLAPAPQETAAPMVTPVDPVRQKDAAPNDIGTDAEPVPAKAPPVTTAIPIAKEENRGENGTPKTSLSPVCDQSGCIKLGDQGQLVEELNLRLMGFGNTVQNPAPLDQFTAATERAVKQFQRDYMGVAETGKVCGKTLAAIDEFLTKYPIPYGGLKCQCHANNPGNQGCTGFGLARSGSASVNHLYNGQNVPGVERPGIHRAVYWSLRAAIFYLHEKESQLGYRFSHISSGYRCWKRAKQMGIFSTNHHGNACDVHFKRASNGSHVDGSALNTLKTKVFVGHMRARPTWDTPNRISLEPTSMTDQWVHMDVREFKPEYKLDRYYAKTQDAANGDPLLTMAKREGRLSLVNCGGIASTTPSPAPKSSQGAAGAPATQPAPSSKPKSPPPPAVPKAAQQPAAPPKPPVAAPVPAAPPVGPVSTARKDARTLELSKLALDFIRVWESGSLTKHHLVPYDDNKGYCTIGVGHLIDGLRSCAALKSSGSAEYAKYQAGITVEQEDALFAKDVKRIVKSTLPSIQVPLHQQEFDALMCLSFNTGGLTKFKKLLAKLNTGNYPGCCDEFADITSGGDKGLVKRRKQEMKMFRSGIYDSKH
jgi:GH24 family phage-related lysozyme (muramidase)/LysM repeat protein